MILWVHHKDVTFENYRNFTLDFKKMANPNQKVLSFDNAT